MHRGTSGFRPDRVVKRALHRLGLDVRLVRNVQAAARRDATDQWRQKWASFGDRAIRTVVDVGANTGQFAAMIRGVFPAARIYSFEPVGSCYAALTETLSQLRPATAFRIALGDVRGHVRMFRSDFSPSSSLLEMTHAHKQEWPQSSVNSVEDVTVERLDDIAEGLDLTPEVLIKVDVQGFEAQVIRGGTRTFGQASVVVVEVGFRRFYEGQSSFHEIYTLLSDLGFSYQGNLEPVQSTIDGQVVLADAIFERASPAHLATLDERRVNG